MDLDVEQLIFEVKERPIVWDTSSELYKDKHKKVAAWTEICGVLKKDFFDKSKEEQETIERLVISKWKNIRDAHVRQKKKEKEINKSGSAKKVCHKYIYADMLGFLERCTELRESEASAEPKSTNDSVGVEPTGEMTSRSNPAPNSIKRSTKHGKKTSTKIENEFASYLKEARELMQKRCQEDVDDEDVSFFKSILPAVKKLKADQKMQFRIHTMCYLQSISEMQGQSTVQHPFQQSPMCSYQQPYHRYFQLPNFFSGTDQVDILNPKASHPLPTHFASTSRNHQSPSTEGDQTTSPATSNGSSSP